MDTARWEKLEALFITALECDDDKLDAFLDESCGADIELWNYPVFLDTKLSTF